MPRTQEAFGDAQLTILYSPTGQIIDVVDENGASQGSMMTKMPTANRPAWSSAIIGFTYFDTTLNKLVVAGAAAYETVTSV